MSRDPELDDLREKMEQAIGRMSPVEIVVRPETIRAFCRIVEETNPVYSDPQAARDAGFEHVPIPDSYLLTLITPLSHELFSTGIGPMLGPLVKGIIHTSSVIEFLEPLYCDVSYRLEMAFEGLVRKQGKMGQYFVGTYPHRVLDARDRWMAVDRHVFFLRTS